MEGNIQGAVRRKVLCEEKDHPLGPSQILEVPYLPFLDLSQEESSFHPHLALCDHDQVPSCFLYMVHLPSLKVAQEQDEGPLALEVVFCIWVLLVQETCNLAEPWFQGAREGALEGLLIWGLVGVPFDLSPIWEKWNHCLNEDLLSAPYPPTQQEVLIGHASL